MKTIYEIILFILCNIFFIYILLLNPMPFQNKYIHHSLIITSIIIYSIVIFYILQNAYNSENFFFEVSPKRKQCLIEQVSPDYTTSRTCGCCPKGTTGGYPAKYLDNDFISQNPEDLWNWQRKDAVGNEASITPPTDKC